MLRAPLKDVGPLSLVVPDTTGNLGQISSKLTSRWRSGEMKMKGSKKVSSHYILKTAGCLRNRKLN